MIPAQIIHEIKIRGFSLRAVARKAKADPGNASRCIQGKNRVRLFESEVAKILNLDPHYIWPQWYPQKEKASEAVTSKA